MDLMVARSPQNNILEVAYFRTGKLKLKFKLRSQRQHVNSL